MMTSKKDMTFKNFCITSITLIASMALSSPARALDASAAISAGGSSIAASPVVSITGGPLEASKYFVIGATFIVAGVVGGVGNTVSVVIQNTTDGSKALIQASAAAVKDAGISVGNGVKVVATSTGYALIASGRLLAFVPNAVGKELLFQSKLSK